MTGNSEFTWKDGRPWYKRNTKGKMRATVFGGFLGLFGTVSGFFDAITSTTESFVFTVGVVALIGVVVFATRRTDL